LFDTLQMRAISRSLHATHSASASSVSTARRLSASAQRRLWAALTPNAISTRSSSAAGLALAMLAM
jgi:hypothetical protein